MKYVFSLIIMCLFSVQSLFALDAPTNIASTYISDASVDLSWLEVSDSIGYYLYYGTTSGVGSTYEFEGVDLLSEAKTSVEGLLPETEYFFSVTSVDESGEESVFSSEVSLMTLASGEKPAKVSPLQLLGVESRFSNTITLEFSKNLETSENASREFILIDAAFGDEILVIETMLDEVTQNKLTLILSSELSPSTEYELTVLDILGADGATIEEGIDGFANFVTPSGFESDVVEEAPIQIVEEVPELNAAGIEEDVEKEIEAPVQNDTPIIEVAVETEEIQGKGGVTIAEEDLSNGTLTVAESTEKLPQTGAEHIFLILVAGLLGVGFYARRKKA